MRKLFTKLSLTAGALALLVVAPVMAAGSTQVVTSDDLTNTKDLSSWFFYNDETDVIDNTLGSFVTGPATAPLGEGSAQVSVSGTQRRNLATYQFAGTPLSAITDLRFSTYNPLTGNGAGPGSQRSAYLNFNVDFDGTDTWQRRLVYVPADNGTVLQDTWQEWDALSGGNALWKYSGTTWPVTGQPGTTTKTWNQILADYPTIRIRVNDSWLGMRIGEPYLDGYTENLDNFVFGTAAGTKTFDFEPLTGPATSKDDCKNNGWKHFNTPHYKNQGDCVSAVASQGKAKGNPIVNFFRSLF